MVCIRNKDKKSIESSTAFVFVFVPLDRRYTDVTNTRVKIRGIDSSDERGGHKKKRKKKETVSLSLANASSRIWASSDLHKFLEVARFDDTLRYSSYLKKTDRYRDLLLKVLKYY